MGLKCHRSLEQIPMQAKNIKPKSVPVKRAIAFTLMPLTWGLVTTIGLASLAPLTLAQTTVAVAMRSPVQILVVNPGLGNDTAGNGSESTPFKTITQALRVAQPNTVILLVPATYSTETGESFPLILKTGVTLQGNPRSRGQDIVIKGGGSFISPTSGEQNITIVGADRSGVTGITITNPNPRGSGLWIESGSPVVVDNTFTGNTQDGISIHGNSATLIRSNYFYENGGNGITISGTSRPDVRDNVLANKGLGIRVTENATPRLTGNRISNNQDGVVVEANAQPLLRNNIIENNQRYGLVAIARSQPDLGTKTEPGGNVFRGNGQFDISNQTQNLSISAFGNQLSDRTEGQINLAPETMVSNTPAPAAPTRPASQEITASRAITPPVTRQLPLPASRPLTGGNAQTLSVRKPTTPTLPLKPAVPAQKPTATRSLPAISASSFPIPSSLNRQPPAAIDSLPNDNSKTLPTLTFEAPLTDQTTPNPENPALPSTPTNTIPIPVPSPVSTSIPPSLSSSSSSLSTNLGQSSESGGIAKLSALNSRSLPALNTASSSSTPVLSPPVPTTASTTLKIPASSRTLTATVPHSPAKGLRYRVIVPAESATQQALVRSLIPDAFRTVLNGHTVMQVGAYSRRDYADEMLQMLASKGLTAGVELVK